MASDEILDVAVIGGGVSGIYSAWRLLTAALEGRAPSIAIFETSTRLGGRLLSVTPPGIPDTRVELGGMRYTPQHVCVAALAKYLGLESAPFPVHEPENIAFLRGRRLRIQDLTNPAAIPYNLLPDERTPTALTIGMTALAAQRTLRTMLHKDVDLATVDWPAVAKTARYHSQHLRDVPLGFLIQRNLSTEAVNFATDTSGYDRILRIWNGADGFPWNLGDFGTTVTYSHVQPGYDTIPLTMAARFKQAGGTIHLSYRLTSFDETSLPDGSKGIELHFAGEQPGRVLARRVILAMPRRSLELLDPSGTVLADPVVRELIGSVTPIPLFKLAMCYSYPWWQTIDPVAKAGTTAQWVNITKGQTLCDMPIRQCYYWAVDPKTQNAVVLIYDDGQDLDYWAGLRNRHTGPPFQDNAPAPDADPASGEWNLHRAPERMVQEAHRQLLLIHGVTDRADIPPPYAASYRDWAEDPFGGGSNYWHLHVDSQHVSDAILQPKPHVPVYICGEAYSHNQGWVEGALETADNVLLRHFGLPKPPWLAPSAEPAPAG